MNGYWVWVISQCLFQSPCSWTRTRGGRSWQKPPLINNRIWLQAHLPLAKKTKPFSYRAENYLAFSTLHSPCYDWALFPGQPHSPDNNYKQRKRNMRALDWGLFHLKNNYKDFYNSSVTNTVGTAYPERGKTTSFTIYNHNCSWKWFGRRSDIWSLCEQRTVLKWLRFRQTYHSRGPSNFINKRAHCMKHNYHVLCYRKTIFFKMLKLYLTVNETKVGNR